MSSAPSPRCKKRWIESANSAGADANRAVSGIEGLPVTANVDVRRTALVFALGFVLTGLAGRASAQDWDLRCQHPCAPYATLTPKMATQRNGDVAARVLVRFAEISESLRLIREIVNGMPAGNIR